MYISAICARYREHAQLVGLCDISPTRMNWHNARIVEDFGIDPIPTYTADQFDRMITRQKPDTVIVTTVDQFHHQYIIRAMELGCDAITEKPMTTDAGRARAIFDAIARTGRKLRVAHNYRYGATNTKVHEILASGAIGQVLHVDFQWLLDTDHGADYFRRWHREKVNSGGLLVHKASHHFDLVNWWIGSFPQRVFALGELKFYGRKNAEARGEKYSYDRYTGHPEARNDPFALFLDAARGTPNETKDGLLGLYLNAEKDSGYIRDRNVFGEPITAEDTMCVLARYRSGVFLNYSLIAYSPWEGLRVSFTGTKGRLELFDRHASHIIAGQTDEQLAQQQNRFQEHSLRVFPLFGVPYDVPVQQVKGGHGGGDPVMLDQIFLPDPPSDPHGRAATHIDGAAAVLMGFAANQSIATGQPVDCDSLLKLP